MARKPSQWPRKVPARNPVVTVYRLEIGGVARFQLRWREMGELHRQTTTDEAAAMDTAERIADRVQLGESSAMNLDAAAAAVYRHALEICGDVPLDVWCREYGEVRRRLGSTPPLHAVDDYVARHKGASIPLNDAINLFMADLRKQGLSADYTRRTGERLERVKTAFGAKSIADITEGDLRAYVDGQGGEPRTQKNVRDIIVTLWRWARREGYLPRDIQTEAERVAAPTIRRQSQIAIFTPDEMRALLTKCKASIQPIIAICGFAGVRSDSLGEISRLRWENVKWGQNVIEVTESKTGARRIVPIQPNLLAWIERHRLATGLIWQGGRIDNAIRRAAASAKVKWKKNGLRHSFGSYRVAQTKSIAETSLEMGNSAEVVRKHYLEAVHEDQAAEWFGIMPG